MINHYSGAAYSKYVQKFSLLSQRFGGTVLTQLYTID